MYSHRPTYAEVNLNLIANNVQQLRSKIDMHVKLMAVVKANACGHGIVEVSRICLDNGADCLGVAIIEEGLLLREKGFFTDILIFGAPALNSERLIVQNNLIQTVFLTDTIRTLSEAAKLLKKRARVHIKVETGMGRIGVEPTKELKKLLDVIDKYRDFINVEGMFSHFAQADAEDKSFSLEQISRFDCAVKQLTETGWHNVIFHMANSAGLLNFRESHFNMVRSGIVLYGYSNLENSKQKVGFRPALNWKTHVVHIKSVPRDTPIGYGGTFVTTKDTLIGTLPVGYGDGYPRLASNKGVVIIKGTKVPIIGAICMDQLMVDVSNIPDVKVGDEAVLIGQQGKESIWADNLAETVNTIPNEILAQIGSRVPRIYK